MSEQDYEQLTLFREDSHASLLVQPGSEKARMMTVTSGLKCLELYKNSGLAGLLAKMLLESSTWHSTRCYLTWKISATPRKHLLFRLVPSMPRTGEIEWQSWPTPTAADSYSDKLKSSQQKPGSCHSLNLSEAVRLMPTPIATDWKNRGCKDYRKNREFQLQTFVGGAAQPGLGGGYDGPPDWLDKVRSGWADGTWELGIQRTVVGSKDRADRLRCLGNMVVPAQFYPIFQAIRIIEEEADHAGE